MKKTLSIVSTPMQLVNCIEYIQTQIKDKVQNTLIIDVNSENRKNQINNLFKYEFYREVFDEVYYPSIVGHKKGLKYFKIVSNKQIVKKISRQTIYDYVISGNNLSLIHRYSQFLCWNNNPNIKIVVVDDGTSTAEIVLLREKEIETNTLQYWVFSRSVRLLYFFRLPKLKYFVPPSLIFFTVYNNLPFSRNDILISCDYSYTKNLHFDDSRDTQLPDVIVIGQPLSAANVLSKERYNKIIETYISETNITNERIVYVPHPAENVSESLDNMLMSKLSIIRPDIPFELWAITKRVHYLVGFYSSVLVNMHFLFPNIKVVSLCPQEILNSSELFLQEAQQSYAYIRNNGIEVIDI